MIELTRALRDGEPEDNARTFIVNPDAIQMVDPYNGEGCPDGNSEVIYREGRTIVVEETMSEIKKRVNEQKYAISTAIKDIHRAIEEFL